MNIDEFMKTYTPGRKRSEFWKYENEIRTLFGKGHSHREIFQYLKEEKGVILKQVSLAQWMWRNNLRRKSNP